ncbi:MAG: YfhO family protein [Chloroflexi bacterium]|nr:YfhO family protein [Chloroflexota bacterium]
MAFDPALDLILAGAACDGDDALTDPTGLSPASVGFVSYLPERIELRVETDAPGLLLLADAYYPGWTATVDGQPAPVYRADVMFRAVPVPAGSHEVVFDYRPWWLPGILIGVGHCGCWRSALQFFLRFGHFANLKTSRRICHESEDLFRSSAPESLTRTKWCKGSDKVWHNLFTSGAVNSTFGRVAIHP